MTAKQKINRERFKAAIAEAKKIREKNPKLTQPQAVKKAWAIIYSKKSKTGAVGNVTIKKAGKNDERYIVMNDGKEHLQGKKLFKKDAETVAKALRIVKKKRSAAAKKTVGKPAAKSMHKDTKSHNVNIRVMSGTDITDKTLIALKNYNEILSKWKNVLEKLEIEKKAVKNNKALSAIVRTDIYRVKNIIRDTKKSMNSLKKHV